MSHWQCCTRHLIQWSCISFQCLISRWSCQLICNIDLKAKLQWNLLNITVQFINHIQYHSLNNSSSHLGNNNMFHFELDQLHLCLIRYKSCTIQEQNWSKTNHLELDKVSHWYNWDCTKLLIQWNCKQFHHPRDKKLNLKCSTHIHQPNLFSH